jgi:hypothetical protein
MTERKPVYSVPQTRTSAVDKLYNDLCLICKPEREYPFAKEIRRKWLADLAYPELKILIEVEGGVFTQGRHTRGIGYSNDCIKYNAAQLLGYIVLRYTTGQVRSGEAFAQIYDELRKRGMV